ncbi:MAG: hypothetical protein L0Z55_08415 [Planctomycetes bacterium]|nr:hypothetical protein [Planctomycetota bacterium]
MIEQSDEQFASMRGRSWRRSPAVLLFLGAFLLYAAASRGYISTVDQQVRYFVAIQLWDAGSVHPTQEQLASTEETFAIGKDGRPISHFGIGQSLAMLPAVAAADAAARFAVEPAERANFRYLAAQFLYMAVQIPATAALGLVAAFLLALRLGCAVRHALATALALGFGTFWYFYTKTFAMDVELTSALLWGVLLLSRAQTTLPATALGSLLAGVPLLYRQEMLLPVALTLAIFAWRAVRAGELSARRLAALFLPAACLGLIVLCHNFVRTGSVASAGYAEVLAQKGLGVFADYPGQHLWAILFGTNKGFLWYNPIFAAAALLLVPGARRWPPALNWGLLPVAAFTVTIAGIRNADTVCGWGPRFLVPITPFLVLGAAAALAPRLAARRYRVGLACFLAANVAFQLVMGHEDHNGLLVQAREMKRVAEDAGVTPLAGARANDIAYRLRNLGVPLGDREWVRVAWSAPALRAAVPPFAQNVWWLKLRAKSASPLLRAAFVALGGGALAAGVLCLALGFAGARPENRRGEQVPFGTGSPSPLLPT